MLGTMQKKIPQAERLHSKSSQSRTGDTYVVITLYTPCPKYRNRVFIFYKDQKW